MNSTHIEEIHTLIENGQLKDAAKEIKAYCLYDFWADYALYLEQEELPDRAYKFQYAVIAYHRITYR